MHITDLPLLYKQAAHTNHTNIAVTLRTRHKYVLVHFGTTLFKGTHTEIVYHLYKHCIFIYHYFFIIKHGISFEKEKSSG